MGSVKVIISTLRRSGSTIFWRCFREGTEAISFDEPFNSTLSQLPRQHEKKTYDEYVHILNENSELFWDLFSPIYALEELDSSFRKRQEEWLEWLFSQGESVVLDTTRCWRKTGHLAEISSDNEVYLIHLHRSPAGFVSSHLLPSEFKSSIIGRWNLFKRRRNFFNIDTGFNYWNLERLTGYGPNSAYSTKILNGSIAPETFYSWKAHVRLLHFWKTAYNLIERVGRENFDDHFLSISYERFSHDPTKVLQQIQNQTGLSFRLDQLPSVHAASPAFREGDDRWYKAAEKVGIEASPHVLFRSK